MKNGIFFVIDSCRFDALKDEKKRRFLFPNLNKVINKSSFFKCVANAQSTQFVLPSLFSLSYPLDYGGYDTGIRNRPLSIVEFLKKKGYQTFFMSNCNQVGITNGYDRGFDKIKACVDFKTLLEQKISRTLKPQYLKEKKKSKIKAKKYLKKEFGIFLDYSIKNIEHFDKSIWTKKLLISNTKLVNLFRLEKKILDQNIEEIEKKIEKIQPGNYKDFLGKENVSNFEIFINRLCSAFIWRFRLLLSKNPNIFPFMWLGHITVKFNKIKFYFYDTIKKLNRSKKPFFLYFHCMDIHDNRDISDFKNYFLKFYFLFKWIYARFNNLTDRRFSYDASLMLLDNHLKKIINILSGKEYKNTVLLITSDHGYGNASARPKRKKLFEDKFLEMYSEDLEVPVIIFENKKKHRKKSFLIDTISTSRIFLERLGFEVLPNYFKGKYLNKKFVISEHAGRGSADMMLNNLYFTVTTSQDKLFTVIEKNKLNSVAYFDLIKDPNEQYNLINNQNYKEKIDLLLDILKKERNNIIKTRC